MNAIEEYTADILMRSGIDGNLVVLGNTVGAYATAVAVFVVALVLFKLLQLLILANLEKIAKRTETDLDDTLVKMVRSFTPPFYAFLAFWIALRPLVLAGFAEKFVTAILIIWIVYQSVMAFGVFIEEIVFRRFTKDRDPTTKSALHLLVNLAKGTLWGFGVILILSNLGVNVTSLLAGVGVMGIAVGFALQGILADLFSSFSLYFDKPFKVGDFITVGTDMGTVERIGVKSTKLRALSGERLIVSNQELTSARVRNYAELYERRVVQSFGVLYETPADKLRAIPQMVQTIIETQEPVRFDRAHFFNFGDSSLDFEFVYYVLDPDYSIHMNIQQEILAQIFEKFEEEGIGFAYPTRTLYLNSTQV